MIASALNGKYDQKKRPPSPRPRADSSTFPSPPLLVCVMQPRVNISCLASPGSVSASRGNTEMDVKRGLCDNFYLHHVGDAVDRWKNNGRGCVPTWVWVTRASTPRQEKDVVSIPGRA